MYQASTPFAADHVPISSTAASTACAVRTASASPNRFDQPRQLVPPAGDEAAVPARRAAAADVLLDDDDPRPGASSVRRIAVQSPV